jgi:hypothetical protein
MAACVTKIASEWSRTKIPHDAAAVNVEVEVLHPQHCSFCSFNGDGGISRVVEEVNLVEVVVSTVYYSIFVVKKERPEGLFIEDESRTMDSLLSSLQMSNNTRYYYFNTAQRCSLQMMQWAKVVRQQAPVLLISSWNHQKIAAVAFLVDQP